MAPNSGETNQRNNTWRAMFAEAVEEKDPKKLKDKLAAAEAAIFQRLQELPQNSISSTELTSLRDASETLLALKTNVLKFPSWRPE